MRNSEMFNHLTKPFLALFLLGLFTPVSQVFSAGGLDMSFDSNIAEYLNKIIATREQNSYLERSYEANFPADPFGAVVEEIQNQKNELIIGGISEIATQLQMKGCSLTQKKISNILYYFEDNFRANMGAQVAKKSNQYIDARPTGGEAEKACVEFNQCYYGNGNFKGDVMTDCKDKFQTWYREGSIRKERFQTVKIAQVGQDKYWNNSLEDSPFDLLYDMSAISKILFESVQEPYQLAFYHLPNRKGSGKSWGASEGTSWTTTGDSQSGNTGNSDMEPGTISGGNGGANWGSTGGNDWTTGNDEDKGITPNIPGINPNDDPEFNDFLERPGENGFSSTSQTTLFGGQMCIGALDQIDEETENADAPTTTLPNADDVDFWEYQDYVEDLIETIDDYLEPGTGTTPPPTNAVSGSGGVLQLNDPNDMEKAIEKVENCFKTCDGLAFDKKLACKAMCICEKRDSSDIDLRDPYKTPGLGPILIVKVCTVPSTNRNFSSRGVTVQSIEEVYGQLFGVVDTLDKSGELGITEQQKEFLDNPASNINFAKSLTFTFDQFIQKRAAVQEVSKQLKEKQTKAEHTILLETLGIANPLDNPESINAYVLVQNPATMTMEGNMMAQVQYDAEVEKQTDLSETPKPMVEPNDTANRTKNIELENTITVFLSQHQMFWIDIETTMREFQTLSKVLLDKK